MVTICSFCGKTINEELEININKKYLFCKCNQGLIPKGSHSYNIKGGNNMIDKNQNNENNFGKDKISLSKQIRNLLAQNKSVEDIMKELNCSRKRILDLRWNMTHKK